MKRISDIVVTVARRGISTFAPFRREERGSLIIFSLLALIGMMTASGMAIDFVRYENTRVRLQATLDRAVLAAAALDQTLDAEDVVNDYFAKADIPDYTLEVTVDEGLNYKTVTATATSTFSNFFLNMVGISDMTVTASGGADERIQNVEISLVLDISGSMASYSRLTNLKSAAKEFVDTVLNASTEDMISISLIPYAGQVNAGEALYEQYNVNTVHGYSHCIEFTDSDFETTTMSTSTEYEQMQHFAWTSSSSSPIYYPWCPVGRQDYAGDGNHDDDYKIVPLSQDTDVLKDAIDDLDATSMTGIHYGMKWAATLLDPGTQGVVTNLIADGEIDAAFAGRPVAYSDGETLKVVVLMTDGENVTQYRIDDWAYDSTSDYDYWNDHGLWWYLYRYVYSYYWSYYYDQVASSSQADTMLSNICSAVKDQGVTVFTVGFDPSSHSEDVLKDCASSSAHYYDVSGTEISVAFSAIAATIQKLKLVQ